MKSHVQNIVLWSLLFAASGRERKRKRNLIRVNAARSVVDAPESSISTYTSIDLADVDIARLLQETLTSMSMASNDGGATQPITDNKKSTKASKKIKSTKKSNKSQDSKGKGKGKTNKPNPSRTNNPIEQPSKRPSDSPPQTEKPSVSLMPSTFPSMTDMPSLSLEPSTFPSMTDMPSLPLEPSNNDKPVVPTVPTVSPVSIKDPGRSPPISSNETEITLTYSIYINGNDELTEENVTSALLDAVVDLVKKDSERKLYRKAGHYEESEGTIRINATVECFPGLNNDCFSCNVTIANQNKCDFWGNLELDGKLSADIEQCCVDDTCETTDNPNSTCKANPNPGDLRDFQAYVRIGSHAGRIYCKNLDFSGGDPTYKCNITGDDVDVEELCEKKDKIQEIVSDFLETTPKKVEIKKESCPDSAGLSIENIKILVGMVVGIIAGLATPLAIYSYLNTQVDKDIDNFDARISSLKDNNPNVTLETDYEELVEIKGGILQSHSYCRKKASINSMLPLIQALESRHRSEKFYDTQSS